jgi:hypothetical protein
VRSFSKFQSSRDLETKCALKEKTAALLTKQSDLIRIFKMAQTVAQGKSDYFGILSGPNKILILA